MDGQIVVVTNQKGGVGKSTLSLHLAAGLAARKKSVALVEADEQGSTSQWIAVSDGMPFDSEIAAGLDVGLPERIVALAATHDYVVVDGIPRADPRSLVALLGVADLAIAPCRPAVLDLWSTEAFFAKARGDVSEINPELRIAIVLNMTNKSRKTLLGAIEMMVRDPARQLPVYRTMIGDRAPIAAAPALGTTVFNMHGASNDPAREEMEAFVTETINLLERKS